MDSFEEIIITYLGPPFGRIPSDGGGPPPFGRIPSDGGGIPPSEGEPSIMPDEQSIVSEGSSIISEGSSIISEGSSEGNIVFPYDIYTIIASYCDYRTAKSLSLALSEPDLVEYCMLDAGFDEKIQKSLLDRGIPSRDLLKLIRVTGSYISGSFILQQILEDRWAPYDIDIYVNKGYYERFINNFKRIMPIVINDDGDIDDNVTYSLDVSGNILDIYSFKTENGIVLQVIVVDDQDIPSYINHHSDFSFCRNAYGGEDMKLIVHEPYSVIHKCCENTNLVNLKVARLQKYMERGFTIIFNGY